MIPVFQTKFYVPGTPVAEQRGNCWTATVASMLELPIEAVPNFVEIDVAGGPDWYYLTYKYLESLGLTLQRLPVTSPPANVPYLVSGLSPRSFEANEPVYHAVIYENGKLIHDPVPNGEGVLTVETVEVIVPLTKYPCRCDCKECCDYTLDTDD